jgi:hypothetical protein
MSKNRMFDFSSTLYLLIYPFVINGNIKRLFLFFLSGKE